MKRDPEKEKFWRGAIAEAAGSGQSVRAFCRQKGLKESLFHAWRRQLRLRDDPPTTALTGFVELVHSAGDSPAGVSIRIDDRFSIVLRRGFDPETLRAAMACLGKAGRAATAEVAGI